MSFEETLAAIIEAKLAPIMAALKRLEAQNRTSNAGDEYLSVRKAAQVAEVHPDTIRTWVKAGRLANHRAGRELRIRRDELHRFLESDDVQKNRLTPEEEAAAILGRRRLG